MEDPFGEGKCLSGQERMSNGVEQRNKPGAPFESLGSFFLSNTGEGPRTLTPTAFLPAGESFHRQGGFEPENKFLTDGAIYCMNEGPGNTGEETGSSCSPKLHIHSGEEDQHLWRREK